MDSNGIVIRIMGLVSRSSVKKLYSKLGMRKPSVNDLLIFCDYSYFDVPVGFKFSHLIEVADSEVIFPIQAEIKMVTQQWGLVFTEGIPKGSQTVANICFDTQSYQLITSKIPVVDYWETFGKQFLLSNVNNMNWKSLYTASDSAQLDT